ncbi:MAG: SH3 domain-containing protein [Acidaminococcus sp.]|nr:SH3 domain-containing protein [Acidaminococcus sp.]MCI2099695.1 SH3 domain-containing protein [Acidaminococcus sp.]MCI2115863.1 SH3 domain-containing protein [Acidaminococcus sp.]
MNKAESQFCVACGTPLTQNAAGSTSRRARQTGSQVPPVPAPAAPKKNKNPMMLILIAVIIGLCAGFGGYYYYQSVVIPKRQAEAEAIKVQAKNEAKAELAKQETAKQSGSDEQAAPAPKPKTRGVITGTEVYVREGPGTNYESLDYFDKGETVQILKIAGDWYEVRRSSGQVGWVYRQYCRAE